MIRAKLHDQGFLLFVVAVSRVVWNSSKKSRFKTFLNFSYEKELNVSFNYKFLISLGGRSRSWRMRGFKITILEMTAVFLDVRIVLVFTAIIEYV